MLQLITRLEGWRGIRAQSVWYLLQSHRRVSRASSGYLESLVYRLDSWPSAKDSGLSRGPWESALETSSPWWLWSRDQSPVLRCPRPHLRRKASPACPLSRGAPPTQEGGPPGERALCSGGIVGTLGQTKEKTTSYLWGFAKSQLRPPAEQKGSESLVSDRSRGWSSSPNSAITRAAFPASRLSLYPLCATSSGCQLPLGRTWRRWGGGGWGLTCRGSQGGGSMGPL